MSRVTLLTQLSDGYQFSGAHAKQYADSPSATADAACWKCYM